ASRYRWFVAELTRPPASTLFPYTTLFRSLAQIPEVPAEIAARVQERLATVGPQGLHAELARRDPAMAARLRPGDRQRLARALAVLDATGRSLAEWQQASLPPPPGLRFHTVLLMPPRDALYAACDARFRAMV